MPMPFPRQIKFNPGLQNAESSIEEPISRQIKFNPGLQDAESPIDEPISRQIKFNPGLQEMGTVSPLPERQFNPGNPIAKKQADYWFDAERCVNKIKTDFKRNCGSKCDTQSQFQKKRQGDFFIHLHV